MKAAVYGATRNMYADMLPSIKSLLINSDVDKIYMLIEDDIFPYELPPECEIINVSDQQWFKETGPNYNSSWSYIILLRVAYPWIFKDLDVILSLDCDTIIKKDISELWDLDLRGYYFAAVKEPYKSSETDLYVCIGVALMNLKMLRESGMTKRLVDELNTTKYMYPEQDVFNLFCRGKIKELPSYYGRSAYTEPCSHPKVVHYAATMGEWKNYILVNYYRNIPFSEIRKDEFDEDLDSSTDIRNNIAGDI